MEEDQEAPLQHGRKDGEPDGVERHPLRVRPERDRGLELRGLQIL